METVRNMFRCFYSEALSPLRDVGFCGMPVKWVCVPKTGERDWGTKK